MTSSKLYKSFFLSALPSLLFINNTYANTKYTCEFVDLNADVKVAADALAKEIRDDHNKNHSPIPGHNAYKDLTIVSVDPNFTCEFEVDDNTHLIKHVDITRVHFQATGVPLFSNYAATIRLTADFNDDCSQIVDGSRSYTILDSNSSLVDALFKKDLTGRNYNPKYHAYADVVFESLFHTNQKLNNLCPNFVVSHSALE